MKKNSSVTEIISEIGSFLLINSSVTRHNTVLQGLQPSVFIFWFPWSRECHEWFLITGRHTQHDTKTFIKSHWDFIEKWCEPNSGRFYFDFCAWGVTFFFKWCEISTCINPAVLKINWSRTYSVGWLFFFLFCIALFTDIPWLRKKESACATGKKHVRMAGLFLFSVNSYILTDIHRWVCMCVRAYLCTHWHIWA